MVELISRSTPRARKKHRCEWCGESIPVGEKHQYIVQKFEGDFQHWRAHFDCIKMMEYLQKDRPYFFEDGFLPYEQPRGYSQDERIARRLRGERYWSYPPLDGE